MDDYGWLMKQRYFKDLESLVLWQMQWFTGSCQAANHLHLFRCTGGRSTMDTATQLQEQSNGSSVTCKSWRYCRQASIKDHGRCWGFFKAIDKDGSGALDPAEVQRGFRRLGVDVLLGHIQWDFVEQRFLNLFEPQKKTNQNRHIQWELGMWKSQAHDWRNGSTAWRFVRFTFCHFLSDISWSCRRSDHLLQQLTDAMDTNENGKIDAWRCWSIGETRAAENYRT